MRIKVVGDIYSRCGTSQYMRDVVLALSSDPNHILAVGRKDIYTDKTDDLSGQDIISPLMGAQIDPEVVIHIMNPEHFEPEEGRFNIGLFFYECLGVPIGIVNRCNKAQAIICPSKFVHDSFRMSGVTVPMEVAHGYIDQSRYPKGKDRSTPEWLPVSNGNKILLFVGAFQHRKGIDALIRAFYSGFTNEHKVTLVMKAYGDFTDRSDKHIRQELMMMKLLNGIVCADGREAFDNLPEMITITEELNDKEMHELYCASSVFVLPSRGEGWGRPYLEAAVYDLPIIGSCWSGQADFLTEDTAYLINGEIAPCSGMFNYHDDNRPNFSIRSRWFEPSVVSLRAAMHQSLFDPSPKSSIAMANKFTMENSLVETNKALKILVEG